jgi:hypothetical protein
MTFKPTHDKTVEESFPASDPPANSGTTDAKNDKKPFQPLTDEAPIGTPTSDRHDTETSHHDPATSH